VVNGMNASERPVGRFAPEDSLVVIVDVQNDFCHPDGTMSGRGKDLSFVHEAVPKIQELIAAARERDIPVVFVRTAHDDVLDSVVWRHRFQDGTGAPYVPAEPNCVTDSWGAELYEIEPSPEEAVVTKSRYSAFSSPQFIETVAGIGRRSLFFAGVATNVCVESSARDAVDHDYFASIVSDASAAYREDEHSAALSAFAEHFGRTVTVEELLGRWDAESAAAG